ncbi:MULTISPECIES: TniQ family protein [Halomonadaceae]|uniref:TniQ family protein n=1 Tax=Halomonadaceae TaxID=28256 RepID=UPI0012FDF330|nr:TniQ family protein [Halomonas venusta]
MLSPAKNELFSSWLMRSAFAHGLTPYRFANYWAPSTPIWDRDIDRSASDELLYIMSCHSGFDVASVERMTLRSIEQSLVKIHRQGNIPFLLSAGISNKVRTRHGLQYCSECFRDYGAIYYRDWRLGFMVVCPYHGAMMSDACPRCDAPLMPHRSTVQRMDRCTVCGVSLLSRKLPTLCCSSLVIAFQSQLLKLANGTPTNLLPQASTSPEAVSVIRVMAGVLANSLQHNRLRLHYGLKPFHYPSNQRCLYELQRVAYRAAVLETLAYWLRDWPSSFQEGSSVLGLTQRTFIKNIMPAFFDEQLTCLPVGVRRTRSTNQLPQEPCLNRCRRTELVQFRQERAQHILSFLGYPFL